jgi:hypothetical protein
MTPTAADSGGLGWHVSMRRARSRFNAFRVAAGAARNCLQNSLFGGRTKK